MNRSQTCQIWHKTHAFSRNSRPLNYYLIYSVKLCITLSPLSTLRASNLGPSTPLFSRVFLSQPWHVCDPLASLTSLEGIAKHQTPPTKIFRPVDNLLLKGLFSSDFGLFSRFENWSSHWLSSV